MDDTGSQRLCSGYWNLRSNILDGLTIPTGELYWAPHFPGEEGAAIELSVRHAAGNAIFAFPRQPPAIEELELEPVKSTDF